MKRGLKKTKPTTVRFLPRLDDWVRSRAEEHPEGQSGVINDAVEFYMKYFERRKDKIYEMITGSNGTETQDR